MFIKNLLNTQNMQGKTAVHRQLAECFYDSLLAEEFCYKLEFNSFFFQNIIGSVTFFKVLTVYIEIKISILAGFKQKYPYILYTCRYPLSVQKRNCCPYICCCCVKPRLAQKTTRPILFKITHKTWFLGQKRLFEIY